VEKLAEFYLEQSQKNTTQLVDLMKQTVTASVEMLNRQQEEAQKFVSRQSHDGADQFLRQLEKLHDQQLGLHKEIEQQFHAFMNVFRQEGSR
jgi:hypothetical protein